VFHGWQNHTTRLQSLELVVAVVVVVVAVVEVVVAEFH
jgi:hypothetical protein